MHASVFYKHKTYTCIFSDYIRGREFGVKSTPEARDCQVRLIWEARIPLTSPVNSNAKHKQSLIVILTVALRARVPTKEHSHWLSMIPSTPRIQVIWPKLFLPCCRRNIYSAREIPRYGTVRWRTVQTNKQTSMPRASRQRINTVPGPYGTILYSTGTVHIRFAMILTHTK